MKIKYLEALHVYGLGVVITTLIVAILLFVKLSFVNYKITIMTNVYYEHYLEFFILVSGFICYLYTYPKVMIRSKT